MNVLMSLAPLLVPLADEVPAPSDVKAGWVAFAVFIGLCVAVAFLGFSLTKHLRRAETNAERGAFDPSDKTRTRHEIPLAGSEDADSSGGADGSGVATGDNGAQRPS